LIDCGQVSGLGSSVLVDGRKDWVGADGQSGNGNCKRQPHRR
jgi:hypothetical protein